MEQQPPDELEAQGIALFFRRTGPRDETEDQGKPDGTPEMRGDGDSLPQVVEGGTQEPTLDELAQRVATLAQEASARYTAWARNQADAVIAAAREQATAEVAEAGRNAAAILADAQATAQDILQGANAVRAAAEAVLTEARAAAEAVLMEATAKAEALLRAALAEAEQIRQQSLLAAMQEVAALLEAKRAEAAAIIGEEEARAEAETQRIRSEIVGAAEAEAQRIREEAAVFAAETRERTLGLAGALLQELRSAALTIEEDILAPQAAGDGQSTIDGSGGVPSRAPATIREPAAGMEREGWMDQLAEPRMAQPFFTDQPVVTAEDTVADHGETAVADGPTPSDGRDTVAAGTAKGRIIAVYGANGGIGKTFVAINLATALAQSVAGGVAIVDGNLQFGEVAARLRLSVDRTLYSLATLGSSLSWPAVRGVVSSHRSGLDAIVAPPQPWLAEHVSSELLASLLGLLQDHYRYVVVDTHTSYDQKTLAALDQADDILVVATQDQFVRRNALSFMTVAKRLGYLPKVRVVLNWFDEHQAPSIDRLEKELRSRVIATIRTDPAGVARRERPGDPSITVDDRGLAGQDVVSLAEAVARMAGP